MLIFLGMGDPYGHPTMIPPDVCTLQSCPVLSAQTTVPVHTLPTASIGEDCFLLEAALHGKCG